MPDGLALTPRERLELAGVRVLGVLPPRALAALARRAPVLVDGEPLDPELAVLLAFRDATGEDGLDRLGVAAGRARAHRQALVFAGPEVPVGAVRELAVEGADGPLAARHYVPSGEIAAGGGGATGEMRVARGGGAAGEIVAEGGGAAGEAEAVPLLVWFHGGGFVIGDLDTHDAACRRLCRHAGVHVLSVAYRLAPEHPFPAAVRDARAALAWAHAHAGELGADPVRVAVGGDSAGGTLAAIAARLAARDGGPAPVAQLLLYPPFDRTRSTPSLERFAEGFYLTAAEIEWYHARYLEGTDARRDDPLVSPVLAPDLGGLAPALVVTAAFDPLRDEGEAYAAALRAAGTPVLERRMPGLPHGFANFGGVSRASREGLAEVAGTLRGLLASAERHRPGVTRNPW